MTEPLSKDTFETFTREHQKYLDSNFEKLTGCINGIKKTVDEVKTAREKAWETHAEECADQEKCQDKKAKKLHRLIWVGCICAAIVGSILAPYLGFNHLVSLVKAIALAGGL